jgi:outer membrane protein TolC
MGGELARAQQPGGETYSLRRAIQVGLANSRTLEDAEYGVEVAKQQVREAWGSILPDISANMSYSRNLLLQEIFLPAEFFGGEPGELRPIKVGTDNTWTAGVAVSQPLFEFGVFTGVSAAGQFRSLQEEIVRGTTQQVVTAVRRAYFNTLFAREELRVTEESIGRVRQNLNETRSLFRAGLVSEYDMLRFEVELANVEANLERAQNGVTAAERALLVEMGLDPDVRITVEGQLNEMDPDDLESNSVENRDVILLAGLPQVQEEEVDALIGSALSRRSDLRQIRSTIQLEEAQVRIEKSEFFPRLTLFSNYNILAQEDGSPNFFGEVDNQRTKTAAAGLRVEMPIFRGFERFARVSRARATVRQSETRLDRAEQETLNQVRSLFDAVLEARARARSQRRAVEQALRGYEIASAEYREGIGSQLQVTDAEVALRQSEFNYAQAVYDHLSARAQLELAVGLVPEAAGEFPVSWEQIEERGDDDAQ